MEGLTARQRDILQFIVDNTEKMGFPPGQVRQRTESL